MRTFVFTIDTEWSPPEVLDETLSLFEEHGVSVTLFCTDQPPVQLAVRHEFALHPNIASLEEADCKIAALQRLYPQAKGIRNHALFHSTRLHETYRKHGLRYHSNFYTGEPFNTFIDYGDGIVSLPIFFMDHVLLTNPRLNPPFSVDPLRLHRDGVYVFVFHPVITFINCSSDAHYQVAKQYYREPEKLQALVNREKRGVQDLLRDILSYVRKEQVETLTCLQLLKRYADSAH